MIEPLKAEYPIQVICEGILALANGDAHWCGALKALRRVLPKALG